MVERTAVLAATRQAHAIARIRGLGHAASRVPGALTDPAICAGTARAILAPEPRLVRLAIRRGDTVVCDVRRPLAEPGAGAPSRPTDLTLRIEPAAGVVAELDIRPSALSETGGISRLALDPGVSAVVLSPDGTVHDVAGRPLAVDGPALAAQLGPGGRRFEMTLADGERVFAVSEPVRDSDLQAVALEPLDKLDASANRDLMIAVALPLLALVVALVVSWIGMNRLVVRWIRRINRVTRLYGAGRLSVRVGPIGTAPSELRALATAFDTMADRVEKRSADLQAALDGRTALLRELHHRVKNNFQLVASLVSLQARRADPAVREALGALEVRVHVIAAAHRAAYAAGEIAAVPFGPLVRDIVEILREGAHLPARQIELAQGPGLGAVDLDTAVSISILIAEVLHPVLEAAARSGAAVGIALEGTDGAVTVTVSGPAAGRATREAGDDLSARLVAIYRRQLDASFHSTPDGHGVRIGLPGREFVVPPVGEG